MDGIKDAIKDIEVDTLDTKSAEDSTITKIPDSDVTVISPEDKEPEKRSFSTTGGVGVEARDVAAKVSIVGDISNDESSLNGATISDSTVNLSINNNKSKTKNTNRFDNLPKLPENGGAQPQLGDGSMSR